MSYQPDEPQRVRNPHDQEAFRRRVIEYQQEYFFRKHVFCAATLEGLIRPDPEIQPAVEAHHIIPWSWAVNPPNSFPLSLVDSRENGIMVRKRTHTTIHDVAKAQLLTIAHQRGITIKKGDFRPVGVDCVSGATAAVFADCFLNLLMNVNRNEPIRGFLAKPVQGGQRFKPTGLDGAGTWEKWKNQAGIYVLEQFYIDHGLRAGHHYDPYGFKVDKNDLSVPEFKRKEDDTVYFRGVDYQMNTRTVPAVGGQPTHEVIHPGQAARAYYVEGTSTYLLSQMAGESAIPI
jgi:hypothetical protein